MNALFNLSDNQVQREFIFNPYQYSGYYGGIGNGKSAAGCIRSWMLSIYIPGNFGLIGRKTYPELRDTSFRDFLEIGRKMNGGTLEEGPLIKSYNKAEMHVTLQNGSEIIGRYMENMEPILSLNLGFAWIDQAEEIPEETYLQIQGRLRFWSPARVQDWKEKTRFKFTPKHYLYVTGNPHPGWVKKRYKLDTSGQYHLFEAPTSANKSNLPEGYIEANAATAPEEWKRRFLEGSWDIMEGQVYKDFDEEVNVIQPFAVPHHWPRIFCLDHGFTNPTAVYCLAINEEGTIFVTKEYYEAGKLVSDNAAGIKETMKGEPWEGTDGTLMIWGDPSTAGKNAIDGKSVQQAYMEHGVYIRPANNNVAAGILKVQEYLKPVQFRKHPFKNTSPAPNLYIFNTCKALIDEFKLYEWEKTPPGKEREAPEKPKKYKDHALDAVRYGIMAITERAVKPKPPSTVDPYDEYLKNVMNGVSDEPFEVMECT